MSEIRLEAHVFEVFWKIFLYERWRKKCFRSTLNPWNAAYGNYGNWISEIGLYVK